MSFCELIFEKNNNISQAIDIYFHNLHRLYKTYLLKKE